MSAVQVQLSQDDLTRMIDDEADKNISANSEDAGRRGISIEKFLQIMNNCPWY